MTGREARMTKKGGKRTTVSRQVPPASVVFGLGEFLVTNEPEISEISPRNCKRDHSQQVRVSFGEIGEAGVSRRIENNRLAIDLECRLGDEPAMSLQGLRIEFQAGERFPLWELDQKPSLFQFPCRIFKHLRAREFG